MEVELTPLNADGKGTITSLQHLFHVLTCVAVALTKRDSRIRDFEISIDGGAPQTAQAKLRGNKLHVQFDLPMSSKPASSVVFKMDSEYKPLAPPLTIQRTHGV